MLKNLMLLVPATLIATSLAAGADPARWDDDRSIRVAVAYRSASLPLIAHDLDRAAREFHSQAESEIFARGWRRQQALTTFREFQRDASRFHAVVEDRPLGRARLEREYQQLLRSYDRTVWALERDVRPSRFLVQDFRRVEVTMNRLIDRFEGRAFDRREYR